MNIGVTLLWFICFIIIYSINMPVEFQLPNENIEAKKHNFEHDNVSSKYLKLYIVFYWYA